MDSKFFLDHKSESSHYSNHQNIIGDKGYEEYLGKLLFPLLEGHTITGSALDFGCGPTKAMAHLYKKMTGESMVSFDPIFFPDLASLDREYDLICACEVVEHFHCPEKSWDQLVGLLGPGGRLGVRTSALKDGQDFESWSYRFDRTHVAFYSKKTFEWIEKRYGLRRAQALGSVQIFSANE